MAAGTIALTNNSTTVNGSGTSFTSEIKTGDFIYVTVGGAPYTLVAASITSDTQMTLAVAFDGPTTSGLAWNSVAASLLVAITQKILNDFASVARGRILDFQNWQKIYSDVQSVDVIRPDRTVFTGPSWGYMANQYKNKLDKSSNLADLPNIPAARDNIGVGYGTSANTVAQGNDVRLNTLDKKSGGTVNGAITTTGPITGPATGGLAVGAGESNRVELNNVGSGGNTGTPVGWTVYRWYNELVQTGIRRAGDTSIQSYFMAMSNVGSWEFQRSGNASAPGSWVNGSDERHKTKIKTVSDPLSAVLSWRGTTYDKKDGVREVGLIAQDVEKICPEAITNNGDRKFMDGTVIPDFKYLNTAGAAAAYHTEAIKTIFEILYQLAESPDEALKTLEVIRKRAEEIKNISIEQESPRKEKPPVFDVPTNEEPVNNEETGS
ncbi:tail fiber domain-containing protein [Pantoea allii]|uniref:Tail fiber domain-containing protein n=1 Tax=Pantoea allii TaxID=574096 RepID=A0ABS6VCS6_9GAMM|nr:tail fiber domain-containing protein [Pantoea allii]MBW1213667.1 tail fiber domain-containing protein [Pantoea allii]MBW1257090.1 tail fiber domain-containing protein [Pantoea allii]MBW1266167.1 tail fiber domain-containing protein [Pantoea allii]MBW1288454.1 tail fiber domain-containing protein [Pantoea allii]